MKNRNYLKLSVIAVSFLLTGSAWAHDPSEPPGLSALKDCMAKIAQDVNARGGSVYLPGAGFVPFHFESSIMGFTEETCASARFAARRLWAAVLKEMPNALNPSVYASWKSSETVNRDLNAVNRNLRGIKEVKIVDCHSPTGFHNAVSLENGGETLSICVTRWVGGSIDGDVAKIKTDLGRVLIDTDQEFSIDRWKACVPKVLEAAGGARNGFEVPMVNGRYAVLSFDSSTVNNEATCLQAQKTASRYLHAVRRGIERLFEISPFKYDHLELNQSASLYDGGANEFIKGLEIVRIEDCTVPGPRAGKPVLWDREKGVLSLCLNRSRLSPDDIDVDKNTVEMSDAWEKELGL